MLYQPDLIVYLWMLPVFVLVVMPLLWTLLMRFYRGLERSRFANVSGFVETQLKKSAKESKRERRQDPRVIIQSPPAVLATQTTCFKSNVSNISNKGICLNDLPQKIHFSSRDIVNVIFRSRGHDYKISARKIWGELRGKSYTMGAEILAPPPNWKDFVKEFYLPQEDTNV